MSEASPRDPLRQELLDIFVGRATRRYGLSDINQLQHALQSAACAEADGAPPATVLASLLHDVGHMIHDLGEDPAARGVDDVHEELGAKWLAERFGPEVAALVAEVTDDKSLPKAERKRLQAETAPHKSDRARLLKMAAAKAMPQVGMGTGFGSPASIGIVSTGVSLEVAAVALS